MSERKPTVTLVAFDPDGGEHKIRTAAQYDWAGLAKGPQGQWELVSKGWSYESVRSRAVTRGPWGARIEVVKFSETGSDYATSKRAEIRADAAARRGPEGACCSTGAITIEQARGEILADADQPVDWAGRGFGQLNADEKRRAARAAGKQLERELQANAAAISAVLSTEPEPKDRMPLIRELAANYRAGLLSAESAMDAIAAAVELDK